MSANILITGATGLLGSHLLERALNDNHNVTVIARNIPQRSYLYLKQNDVQIISKPIEELQTSDFGTYDYVIHAAAKTSAAPQDTQALITANFENTVSLHKKLQDRYVKWIQISSVATMCDGTSDIVNESFQGKVRRTAYAESKLLADQYLEENTQNTLYIHPCYLLGKWDSKPSSGAIFYALRMQKIKYFKNNFKNFVNSSDVAAATFQALVQNCSGHYLIGNENLEISDFFQKSCLELNCENITIPSNNENDWADSPIVKEFCQSSKVDFSKAVKDFNYQPQKNTQQSILESIDYFSEFKMLKRKK